MTEFTDKITIKQLIDQLKGIDDKIWKVVSFEVERPPVEDEIETARLGGIYQCYKPGPEVSIRIYLEQRQ